MTPQPKIDVEFINDMLSYEGRKDLSPFKLNRLDKAIKILERGDSAQGAAARADYYCYINQPYNALKVLDEVIKRYGYGKMIARSTFRAAMAIGEWEVIKTTINDIIECKELFLKTDFIEKYIDCHCLYLDNSSKFINVLTDYKVTNPNEISSHISERKNQLLEQDCSLSVYRKVLAIAFQTIYKKYSILLDSEFRLNNMQIIISSKHWTLEETVELTEDINNEILKNTDIDFQIAADDIEVFCINFSKDKLPDDFVYYDDDDSDLIKLVQKRMEDNPSSETDGEELYV